MARLLQTTLQKTILPIPGVAFFVVLLGVISVFSIVGFLCGLHGSLKRSNTYKKEKNTMHLGDKKPRTISKLGCGLSSKALLMTKMISWKKVDECDDDDVGDEEAVWKRTIIKGERCRPLDFSGRISYDENGNPMPESPSKHVASDGDSVVKLQKS